MLMIGTLIVNTQMIIVKFFPLSAHPIQTNYWTRGYGRARINPLVGSVDSCSAFVKSYTRLPSSSTSCVTPLPSKLMYIWASENISGLIIGQAMILDVHI